LAFIGGWEESVPGLKRKERNVTKIAFIGAGSLEFTRNLARDILTFPLLKDATLALMDVDAERLEFAQQSVQRIVDMGNYPARVEATMSRAEALEGADAVLCTILVGGTDVWRHDIEIPKKYGVDINTGVATRAGRRASFARCAPSR